MADYYDGEFTHWPARYINGQLIPSYHWCFECLKAFDSNDIPWDEETRRDVPCPKCGTPLCTSMEVTQFIEPYQGTSIEWRYQGWYPEDRKWAAENNFTGRWKSLRPENTPCLRG